MLEIHFQSAGRNILKTGVVVLGYGCVVDANVSEKPTLSIFRAEDGDSSISSSSSS
jgi:hypothetical protein